MLIVEKKLMLLVFNLGFVLLYWARHATGNGFLASGQLASIKNTVIQ